MKTLHDTVEPPSPSLTVDGSAAAVDLGSNSFHMIVARIENGLPVIVDRLREPVQLAAGLLEDGRLTRKARRRARECLERFGQRVRDFPMGRVLAVGTNTLRRMAKSREFLQEAEAALGHPIEVISGVEEARLIYLGVSHSIADEAGRRLVVDIGGGSTECIVGQGFEPEVAESLPMGCVAYSLRFFPDGALKKRAFEEARTAARLELRRAEDHLRRAGWQQAIGASGTIRSVSEILRLQAWSRGDVTRDGIKRLKQEMLSCRNADELQLAGLKPDRRRVLAGGLAILEAVFQTFDLESMQAPPGALREGLLYDLVGRLRNEDVRDRTIGQLEDRFRLDREHSTRVEQTALEVFRQVRKTWQLDRDEGARFLSWAVRLHEVGLAVTFHHHHRHGGYLVEHSDMAGFSRDDKLLLAALVESQRGKPNPARFRALDPERQNAARQLAVLMRLAVRLHRGRNASLPELRLQATPAALRIAFPDGWLDRNPLTRTDLVKERERWRSLGIRLIVVDE